MFFRFFTKILPWLLGATLVASVISSSVADDDEAVVTPNMIVQEVQQHPLAKWKAEISEWTTMPITEAQGLLGTEINYGYVDQTNGLLECSLCKTALGWVEGYIQGNATLEKIQEALEQVCQLAPTSSLKTICQGIVESHADELVKWILSHESPDAICRQLGVCTTAATGLGARFKIKDKEIECMLCKYIVYWMEDFIQTNFTEEHIILGLDQVCSDLLDAKEGLICKQFVEAYTPKLVSFLIHRTSPDIICDRLQMCSETESIPETFDGRVAFGSCIHPVRDQGKCGSCWAFSASEVLGDRFCIFTHGRMNAVLSPQTLVSCDTQNKGCQGGSLDRAWQFLSQTGIATDVCEPYISGSGDSGTCPSRCADGSSITFYRATHSQHVWSAMDLIKTIQIELMWGPVQVAFEVYQDFMAYRSGVYHHLSGSLLGGHAVEMIGWGVENNTPYWLVKNSWSSAWGMSGYFKILRGANECGIESNVYTGTPLSDGYLFSTIL